MSHPTTRPAGRTRSEDANGAPAFADHRRWHELVDVIGNVVQVQRGLVETLLAALLARGHVLIEGIPGVGKTLLARTLAKALGCRFQRIQFTNDLMPSDVVGGGVWRAQTQSFEFVPGPLFSDLVLADEINRTSPRTLSCLLEAMENGKVSIDGSPRSLGAPFFVMATRNGIEFQGTYPMPEAALDRFLVRVEIGYPSEEQELALFLGDDPESHLEQVRPVVSRDELLATQQEVGGVHVSESVARYCRQLAEATRGHPAVALGASPRAAMALLRVARACAFLAGRDHVLPDDLQRLLVPVLSHRLVLHAGGDVLSVLDSVLRQTPVEL